MTKFGLNNFSTFICKFIIMSFSTLFYIMVQKYEINLHFRSPCTNFNLLRSLKLGGGSEKCKQVCFFSRLALTLSLQKHIPHETYQNHTGVIVPARPHRGQCCRVLERRQGDLPVMDYG